MTLSRRSAFVVILLLMLGTSLVGAFDQKKGMSELDALVFFSPELRVVEWSADAELFRGTLPAMAKMDVFRAVHGETWRFTIDEKRGLPTLISGGSIPFIPGNANDLPWSDIGRGCDDNRCIPTEQVEALARAFVDEHHEILGVGSSNLVLDPAGTKPVGNHLYFLRFAYEVDSVPVDQASLFFRINGGNLIQVASEKIAPVEVETMPSIDRATGWAVVQEYLGRSTSLTDSITDRGSLHLIPVTPKNIDPDAFDGALGSGFGYKLAWRYAFDRPGIIGSWEAVVDAHTGELLRFVDRNRYGRAHGGAYPGDNHTGEADRPMAFVDTGWPAPNQYADAGGIFPGDTATATLQGKYARIDDDCGPISNTTTDGDLDFSLGAGTDCDVPAGNTGGAGNTHAARTQYYHLTTANIRAQGYRPDLTWLAESYISVTTNQSPWCNATSGMFGLNFYRPEDWCWNLGEIPGVSIHEWGHSLDDQDGSGGQSTPVETYADWMAALHLHDSCVGRGFYLSGNCTGDGDACVNCSGVRDMDWTQHEGNTPWTPVNYGTLWSGCESGSYFGPCGLEDHCEAGFSSQALWDLVNRKLTAAPHNMDLRSAWLLADRLWYGGIGSLGSDMYSCSPPTSNGCGGSHLFQVMLAVDDDDGNLGNGTPHADAIYAAMADHNIACGDPTDPENQSSTSCPTVGTPNLNATAGNNFADLAWNATPGATRYWIYRSDIGCDAGFIRIAEVSGATAYNDMTVVNDIAYYYVIQGVAASDACVGPISTCEMVVPIPCEVPLEPTALTVAAAGDHQIALSWASGGPVADTYNVYRAVGACPQSDYELVASGIAATSWVDNAVSGQVDYAYVVTASDVTAGCESVDSNCDSTSTTGACTQAPSFDGVQTVVNPAADLCSLDLAWDPAAIHCTGPAVYDVYRSIDPGFIPGPGDRIASGLGGTTFNDTSGVVSGESYTYMVRAVDSGNGSSEGNVHRVSGVPTGTIAIGTWTDNAGDDGDAKLITEAPWSAAGGEGVTGAGYATDTYASDTCAAATTPTLTLGPNPQLSFWSKYDIELNWDKGLVQISTDGGGTWQRVNVNYPGSVGYESDECDLGTGDFFNATSTTWNEYTASLIAWAGSDVQLRFVLSTDGSVVGDGWWVDDISITDVAVAGECSTQMGLFADDFESGDTSGWGVTSP